MNVKIWCGDDSGELGLKLSCSKWSFWVLTFFNVNMPSPASQVLQLRFNVTCSLCNFLIWDYFWYISASVVPKKVWTYKTNQNDTNCSLGFQVTFFLCVNCDYHQMAFVFRGPSRPVGVPALFALAVGRGVANPLQTRAGDWGDWQQDLCGVDCWFFSHQRQPNEATWWSSDSRGSLSDPPWWWGGTRQGLGLSRAGRWSSGEVAHPYFFAGSSGREALRS